jgi:DNA-binding NtrC family response regulator
MERVAVLSSKPLVGLADIPCEIRELGKGRSSEEDQDKLSDSEKNLLEQAIQNSHGNLSAAARELGIDRGKMRYRMHKYKLD